MKKKSKRREKIEADLAKYLRKKTRGTNHPFIPTRELFEKIDLDYDDKNDYRNVFVIIHEWRRQAPFFYDTIKNEGKLNGHDYYNDFEEFLIDFNAIGGFYLWHTTQQSEDGSVIHGMYQPTLRQKQQADADRNLKTIRYLENKFLQMQIFGQKLPSGLDPEKALLSIGRYKSRYLLPENSETEE
jgi:hypothetical protein